MILSSIFYSILNLLCAVLFIGTKLYIHINDGPLAHSQQYGGENLFMICNDELCDNVS